MSMNWVIKASISVGALMAMAACSSSTTTGAGGSTTTTTDTGTTDTGTTSTDTGTTSTAATCDSLITSDLSGWSATYAAQNSDAQAFWDCACGSGTPCSLVCNDSSHPGFCAGMAPVAGGSCVTCLTTTTGSSGCADQYNTCKSN